MQVDNKLDLVKRKFLNYKNPRDIGAIIIVIVIVFFAMQVLSKSNDRKAFMDVGKDYSTGWIDEKGEKVSLDNIVRNKNCKMGDTYVIKKKLSEKDIDVFKGESICFLTKSVSIKCYIDGEKVIETREEKTILDTDSPGSTWNFYRITEDDIGKNFEIHITIHFDDNSSSIEWMRIANEREYILSYIYDKAIMIVILAIILGFAFVLIAGGILLKERNEGGLCELLMSLGVTMVTLVVWLGIDTQILPFFLDCNSLFQAMSIGCLYLLPLSAAYVLKNLFKLENKKYFNILIIIVVALNIVVWTLHLADILDLHNSLPICHVYLVSGTVAIVADAIYEYIKKPKNYGKKSMVTVVKVVAVIVLLMGIIVDITRFNKGDLGVGVSFIHVDMILVIIYCVTIAFSRVFDMNYELKQSEFIKKLAYQDGLTGVKNRTAYMEKLDDIRNKPFNYEKIGIVAFDVNNLKMVNDLYGHAEGDTLISTVAELIGKSFVENCKEYRIGGDEFIVVINAPNAEKIYKMGMIQFKNSVQNYNNFYSKEYKISVAVGVAFCDNENLESRLNDTIKEADTNMYIEKEKMKKEL